MKNFGKIYSAIKEIEEETLFKFAGQDDEEFVFEYESELFNQYVKVDSSDLIIEIPKGCNAVLLNTRELTAILRLMKALKEVEE